MKVTPEAPLRFVDQADILGLGQIALDVVGWGSRLLRLRQRRPARPLRDQRQHACRTRRTRRSSVPMRSFLFRNEGEQGFVEVGREAGEPFVTPIVGRGASFADFDGDGDLDLAVVVNGGAAAPRAQRRRQPPRLAARRAALAGPQGPSGAALDHVRDRRARAADDGGGHADARGRRAVVVPEPGAAGRGVLRHRRRDARRDARDPLAERPRADVRRPARAQRRFDISEGGAPRVSRGCAMSDHGTWSLACGLLLRARHACERQHAPAG